MELGLLDAGINEIIAVTRDNAAPIGIIQKPGQTPKMILFKGSKTVQNILDYGWVTANFVSDSYPYAFYAFNDCRAEDLAEISAGGREMQTLASADAWIAFETRVVNETEQTYFVELTEIGSAVIRTGVRPINRGFNSIIDAAVHATRYVMHPSDELQELIEYHLGIAKKCGGKSEARAAELIQDVCGLQGC
ncbi:MAG TPA: DUF447 family protein [Methanocorpusculum sp.]|nr:DUF447 family protein [Methanocorpusculum sp.]